MIVDLRRTFSEHTDAANDGDDQDWSQYLDQRRQRQTWSNLHAKVLVVVLGEAGIGKTIEFQSEVRRLQEDGQAAFFIPLNQLSDADSWQLVLSEREPELVAWAAGKDVGYFFLDAVDEARLKSHAAFETALAVVQRALDQNLARVRIAISSRVTDWSTPAVRSAVDRRLATPITRALAAKAATEVRLTTPDSPTVSVSAVPVSPPVEAFVVSLDPLSNAEARRCALAFGLQDESLFWAAVTDGDYEFMATRPLDLQWMVILWNERRSLGTYLQLIEANISNRLREFNESYEAAGEVLSVDQLRAGAIELAAAAEFGGCAFFTLDPGVAPSVEELAPHAVLTDWQPTAVRRLLATAVFDEASFGRVKFHHRSIREYLAAQWVARQLALGVPFQRLEGLFVGRPFGEPVLIPARRSALSWFAAINVEAREWVVGEFPEIFLYEGDPQAWDGISADKAFANFINASKRGLRVSWSNSSSEYMRMGRALGAGKVAAALADVDLTRQAKRICFHIARHAKLADCGATAFELFRNTAAQDWERALALDVLEFVGSADQRTEVLTDLMTGQLDTDELIAHALPVTDWKRLTVAELSAIFNSSHTEKTYGSGPMVQMVKYEFLPATDLSAALLLLEAVMASMPQPVAGKRFARFPESDQPEKAWLLDAMPDCYERVLALLPRTQNSYPAVCVEAAERIEAQRDSGFTDREEFSRLQKAIAQHPELRWSIALAIAQSEDIVASVNRLTWGASCLVNFDVADLTELTRRANDPALPHGEREVWFAVGVTAAFSGKHRRERAVALRTLGLGDPGSSRSILVGREYDRCRKGADHMRKWKTQEAERKAADAKDIENYKSRLFAELAHISDGSHVGALQGLLHYSFSRSGQSDYSNVDFHAIATGLSPDIATAFEEGLKMYWSTVTPPNPSDYIGGIVPWTAFLALAGLRCSLHDTSLITALPASEVTKAAQLAVWELNGPPPWFETLVRSHPSRAEAALTPWVVAEANSLTPGNGVRGALELALRCAPDIRRGLLAPLVPLVTGDKISRRETLRAVIEALREDGLLLRAAVNTLCQRKIVASIGVNGQIGDIAWLRIWMDEDAAAAWSWFLRHAQGMTNDVEVEVSKFAEVVGDLKWLKSPLSQADVGVLLGIHAMLSASPPTTSIPEDAGGSHFFGRPSEHLREAIPNVLAGARGQFGHDALGALLNTLTEPAERSWVTSRVTEHAALDAAQAANRTTGELRAIGSPFLSEPRTEAQLYEQVIARLEEIRKNLQEGPFSERVLFTAKTPEKHLQLWLAAKFRETQNVRFSVHREEEVDADKKTDIQLSASTFNVCVEIKLVAADRGYSANSLTETLRTQLVGQYLKGYNSSRGILVLMQLDNKAWDIPGGSSGQPFPALVSYLEAQAESIKSSLSGVNELAVFGIRCVV